MSSDQSEESLNCPMLAPKVRARMDRVSGRPALLYPEGVLLLNPTGSAIVELCDGERTVAAIVQILSDRYGIPADQLSGDVSDFLRRLKQKRLLLPGTAREDSRAVPLDPQRKAGRLDRGAQNE
jgi:pyrroloquinoline quinone biosynthesis protein D